MGQPEACALSVIILAAGKGKRMASQLPKVLQPLGGKPLLERVCESAQKLQPKTIHVVYGNGGDLVRSTLSHLPVQWTLQQEQLGTGHAVMQAIPFCEDSDRVLILYGDVPLISPGTLTRLLQTPTDALGILVTNVTDPAGFGRIIRDESGKVLRVVEHLEATSAELQITEINTGILVASAHYFKSWLSTLGNSNTKGEYYLTDVIRCAEQAGVPVDAVSAQTAEEVQGINDLWQLAQAERHYQESRARALCLSGVRVSDPKRLDIRTDDIHIDPDVVLEPNVILEGRVRLGAHTVVGANVILKNVTIGNHVTIEPNTIVEDATIAGYCKVGPFARIRPGTVLEEQAHIGNFVEVKKTKVGRGSKANHLSYLGDAIIGCDVNIGAGTITCNYDGAHKWTTTIADRAFIGSNTSLIAPVFVGNGATIGAGSTISQDAPAEQLTVARARQKTVKGWRRPTNILKEES